MLVSVYLAGLENAELFFSVIFFVVVTSVLIQGPTIPLVARTLNLDEPVSKETRYPIELESEVDTKAALKEVRVIGSDYAVGKQVLELGLPGNVLITLINRDGRFLVPQGSTVIEDQDRLLILSDKKDATEIQNLLTTYNGNQENAAAEDA